MFREIIIGAVVGAAAVAILNRALVELRLSQERKAVSDFVRRDQAHMNARRWAGLPVSK